MAAWSGEPGGVKNSPDVYGVALSQQGGGTRGMGEVVRLRARTCGARECRRLPLDPILDLLAVSHLDEMAISWRSLAISHPRD